MIIKWESLVLYKNPLFVVMLKLNIFVIAFYYLHFEEIIRLEAQ